MLVGNDETGVQIDDLTPQLQSVWDNGRNQNESFKNSSGWETGFRSSLFQITGDRVAEMVSKIVPLGEEIYEMRIEKESEINPQQPENSIRISGRNVVYYNSASIMGNNCTCMITFGGEKKSGRLARALAAGASLAGINLDDFIKQNCLTDKSTWYHSQRSCLLCIITFWFLFV